MIVLIYKPNKIIHLVFRDKWVQNSSQAPQGIAQTIADIAEHNNPSKACHLRHINS